MKRKYIRYVASLALATTLTSSVVYAKEIPIHGNWCGPEHPKEGYAVASKNNLKTVDDLDRACKKHDQKYASCFGKKDGVCLCKADEELYISARVITVDPKQNPETQTKALLVAEWFHRQTQAMCVFGFAQILEKAARAVQQQAEAARRTAQREAEAALERLPKAIPIRRPPPVSIPGGGGRLW